MFFRFSDFQFLRFSDLLIKKGAASPRSIQRYRQTPTPISKIAPHQTGAAYLLLLLVILNKIGDFMNA